MWKIKFTFKLLKKGYLTWRFSKTMQPRQKKALRQSAPKDFCLIIRIRERKKNTID